MTSIYAEDHASALADIRAAGFPVTFRKIFAGTYDEATDLTSDPYTRTVTGAAIRVSGSPRAYEQLSLKQSEAPSLLFAPDTQGELPEPGAETIIAGAIYVVRDVAPLAIDMVAILATIIVVGGGPSATVPPLLDDGAEFL